MIFLYYTMLCVKINAIKYKYTEKTLRFMSDSVIVNSVRLPDSLHAQGRENGTNNHKVC